MRMYTTWTLLLSLCLYALPTTTALAASKEQVIINWVNYLSPTLVTKFESRFDANVTEIYYPSDEQRTQMLVNNSAVGYDLILTSGIDLAFYAKRGWLRPLNPDAIPNLRHIAAIWRNAFQDIHAYGLPFFWGTVGILYRSDLVLEPISHWLQLYQPAAELQGRIGMIADGRERVGMALKALNYPLDSVDNIELDAVEALVVAQQSHVRSYDCLNLDTDSEIISGEIWASMIYSGDALMVQEHNAKLRYQVPEEGTNLWVDYFVLGAKAREPALASAFLNFINEPENAAEMVQYVYYATPNKAAEKYLPAEFLANQTIYPPNGDARAFRVLSTLKAARPEAQKCDQRPYPALRLCDAT
ncbi:MAG: spermidine/putrescine transport system substrate-binding protein [Motiliproteus sp.]|jgi:spermidine/putrescine transport system substrate-binding protein